MGERAIRWVIFGAMVVAFPALYFLFVIAGLLPLLYVAWLTRLDPSLWLPNVVHLVIWGEWAGLSALALIMTALAWVALQPIYGVGHSDYAGVSVYRLFVPPAQPPPMVAPR